MRAPRPEEFERREEAAPTPRELPRALARELPYPGIIRWGPVFQGVLLALSVATMLWLLGVAVALTRIATDGVTAAYLIAAGSILCGVALAVSLFLGGWHAARASNIVGTFAGIVQGAVVWSIALILGLVPAILGAAAGLGILLSQTGIPALSPDVAALVATGAWWSFAVLLVGLIAALLGGWVGSLATATPETRR